MLSIITITRNDRHGLERTVRSTEKLRSLHPEIEQIIVDGSDEALAIDNHTFCSDQKQLRYYHKEPKGISDAFNFGISRSSFEWLWFLNGGDALYRNLDLNCFCALLKNVRTDLLIFQIELMQQQKIVDFPPLNDCFPPVKTWIPHPATLIKKSLFEKYGSFDQAYRMAMDYEFWLRVLRYDVQVNMISMPLTSYDEQGMSSVHTSQVFAEGRKVIGKYWASLVKLKLRQIRSIYTQHTFFKRHANYGNR